MTVSELIKKLEKVKDKELEVVIEGTDPTDWIYYNPIEGTGVRKVYLNDFDNEKTKVFIIDGGMF
jgi:hypothetical protein